MKTFIIRLIVAPMVLLTPLLTNAANERGSVQWCEDKEKQLAQHHEEGAALKNNPHQLMPAKKLDTPMARKRLEEAYRQFCQ